MQSDWITALKAIPRTLVFALTFFAVSFVLTLGYIVFLRQPYVILADNIRANQAAAIVAAFDETSMPYRLEDEGRTILVPRNQLSAARLQIAGPDISPVGLNGFELFDESNMGLTEFAQQVKYQRALQGELVRTLLMIEDIADVRVHISIPEQGLFRGGDVQASAAVTLITASGAPLSQARIVGVQRLVSAAVPRMPVDNVVILDASGAIVSPLPSTPSSEEPALTLTQADTPASSQTVEPVDTNPAERADITSPSPAAQASTASAQSSAPTPADPTTSLPRPLVSPGETPLMLQAPDAHPDPVRNWDMFTPRAQREPRLDSVDTVQADSPSVPSAPLVDTGISWPQSLWVFPATALLLVGYVLVTRRFMPKLSAQDRKALAEKLEAALDASEHPQHLQDHDAFQAWQALSGPDRRAVKRQLAPFKRSLLEAQPAANSNPVALAFPPGTFDGKAHSDRFTARLRAAVNDPAGGSDFGQMTQKARRALQAVSTPQEPTPAPPEAAS